MGISKVGNRYRARLYYKGTTYNIGNYATHIEASRAVNDKRKELKREEKLDHYTTEVWTYHKDKSSKPSPLRRLWSKLRGNGKGKRNKS